MKPYMSKEEVSQAIRDYSKELTGRRDSYGSEEDIGALTHDELMDYYEEMFDSPEALEFQAQREKEDQKFSDSQVGFEDQVHPLENSPFRQGMSRRTESVYITEKNKMKITKRQLRRIIREEKARLMSEISPASSGMASATIDNINTNIQVPAGLFNELTELLEDIAESGTPDGKRAGDLLIRMERELGIL